MTFLLLHILLHKTNVHLHEEGDDHSPACVKLNNVYKVFVPKFLKERPPWSSGHTDKRIGGTESQRSGQLNRIHLTEERGPPLMNSQVTSRVFVCVCVYVDGAREGVT